MRHGVVVRACRAPIRDRQGPDATPRSMTGGGASVEDLVGLAVDLLLLGGGQVALLLLLRGARLGVPRMRLVGHRVLALLGQPELGLRLRIALLRAELSHR